MAKKTGKKQLADNLKKKKEPVHKTSGGKFDRAINNSKQAVNRKLHALNERKAGSLSKVSYFNQLDEMKKAFALFKIVRDKKGKPVDYIFLEVNDYFEKSTGLKINDVIGKKIGEVFKGISKQWMDICGKVSTDGKTRQIEFYSKVFKCHINVIAFFTSKGKLTVVTSDVTQRKKNEERLKLYSYVLQSISEYVTITDMNDNIIFANKAFLQKYGYKEKELIGRPVTIVRPDDTGLEEGNKTLPKTIISGGWSDTFWNKKKDGTKFYIRLSTSIVKDDKNKPIALVGVARDVTAQRKSRESIKNYASLLNTTLNSTVDGIAAVNLEGKIVVHNLQFVKMWKLSPDTLTSHASEFLINFISRQLKNQEEFDARLAALNSKPEDKSFDILLLKDGRTFEAFSQPQLIGRKPVGRVWSFRDITKHQKMNSELMQLNATKDKFFSIIAHDLKSPFQGLLGYTDLLLNDFNSLNEIEKYELVEGINNLGKGTYKLLENLLRWARLQTGNIFFNNDFFNLNEAIQPQIELMQQTAKNKNIDIKYSIDRKIFVIADLDMLQAIIRNLISNAIKFTHPGGNIFISAQDLGDKVQICVEDTGIGISKENIQKLFKVENSFSTKGTKNEEGTGLGLLLCKEMIDIHRGEIWVESEPGKGTKFFITIPSDSNY